MRSAWIGVAGLAGLGLVALAGAPEETATPVREAVAPAARAVAPPREALETLARVGGVSAEPAAIQEPSTPLEPSEQAIAQLERASARGDLPALAELATTDPTPLRYEALRRLLEAGGGGQLTALESGFDEPDPVLHEILGEAFGAGGTPEHAQRLAVQLLWTRADSARLAMASAVVEIAARGGVEPLTERQAIDALTGLARGADLDRAEGACAALGRGARTLEALERVATDRGLDPGVRLSSAEALRAVDPARALPLLEAIALDHPRHPVGVYAQALLRN